MLWNRIEVKQVAGKSRLIELVSQKPLKLMAPCADSGDRAQVIVCHYGGGFLSCDQTGIQISCRQNSSLFLGQQGNGRVYKNKGDSPARMTMEVEVEEGACYVQHGDPLVLHQNSRFNQRQKWNLQSENCSVLNLEWFSIGRQANGEKFAFKSFYNDFSVHINARPFFIDRFCCEPAITDPLNSGCFGEFGYMLNIFLFGAFTPAAKIFKPYYGYSPGEYAVSASFIKNKGFFLRGLCKDKETLNPLENHLFCELEDRGLFFNPLKRKY
ncbi:MAG: urease accessory protein UreD [Desulfobacteraceae bacterium]|nr:urease accessory protein UreD [Desulfobacteraceae bacterium]